MVLSWRRRTAGHHARKAVFSEGNLDMDLAIPTHFLCPISLDLMKDPVMLPTGITYDRESIEKWVEAGNQRCPVTNQVLRNFDQIPNHAIRRMIQNWCVGNQSRGIERIPTPRIPVAPREVSEVCSRILAATQRGDDRNCQELVEKIKRWGRESERNKKCIVECGAGYVLSVLFESFSSVSIEEHEFLLGETLSALTWMFPLGSEGQSKLGSPSSLRCMAWFLKGRNLSTRQTAVLALRQLLALDEKHVIAFVEIEGVEEALVKIVKEQICPISTKSSLMVITHLTSQSTTSERIISRFLELDLVSLILEIVVGSEKSTSEKALQVLDNICSWEDGIKNARENALMMPVLVKKILRISNTATDFSVSVIWKLCRSEGGDQQVEALQLGAFHKLLMVLQVGCGERTKEKATGLLKLLNQYRDRLDCFDSSLDFKYLKRPSL